MDRSNPKQLLRNMIGQPALYLNLHIGTGRGVTKFSPHFDREGLDNSCFDQLVIQTDRGRTTDRYVLALGNHSAAMLRPLGLRLPVYPVKGYSITVPIADAARALELTLMDESYKIAITRLGDRIRVGGMAEISGYNNALPKRRRTTLVHSLTDLFPDAGDIGAASYWSGLRSMTPDGTPGNRGDAV